MVYGRIENLEACGFVEWRKNYQKALFKNGRIWYLVLTHSILPLGGSWGEKEEKIRLIIP